jgi:hypothetical protein
MMYDIIHNIYFVFVYLMYYIVHYDFVKYCLKLFKELFSSFSKSVFLPILNSIFLNFQQTFENSQFEFLKFHFQFEDELHQNKNKIQLQ